MSVKTETLTIDNADIRFRNFAGRPGQYNKAGDRNFCVLLDDDIAATLKEEGWNVKYLKPRDEGDLPKPYLQIKVNFEGYKPPNLYLVSSRGKNRLDEEDVKMLDFADLARVDMIIRPYEWEINGKTGITAYLKTMYAVIEEDDLDLRYSNTPDSDENTIGGCGCCDACDGSCSNHHEG